MSERFAVVREMEAETLDEGKKALLEDFTYKREEFSTGDLEVRTDYRVNWGDGWHATTCWGFQNLLSLLDIPEKFGLSIPPELMQRNCERLRELKNEEIIVFLRKDGIAVNFVEKPYPTARSFDILKLLEKMDPLEVEKLYVSDRGVHASVPSEEFGELQPRKGDISKIGYKIESSQTGGTRPKASFLIYRLACENGATLVDEWGTARWTYDKRMNYDSCLEKFERDLRGLRVEAKLLGQRYKALVNRQVEDEKFVKIWRTTKRILDSRKDADQLLAVDGEKRKEILRQVRKRRKRNKERLNKHPDRKPESPEDTEFTGYQLYNEITNEAKKYDFTAQKKLERLGGKLINLVN